MRHKNFLNLLQEKNIFTEEQVTNIKGTNAFEYLIKSYPQFEEEILQAKAQEMHLSPIDLSRVQADPKVISLITEEIAKKNELLPLKKEGNTLWIAIGHKLNPQTLDEIKSKLNCRVVPMLASPILLAKMIEEHYGKSSISKVFSTPPTIQSTVKVEAIPNDVEQAPVIKMVNSMIHQAIEDRASDIHVEPQNNGVRVRYRIDGVLLEATSVPKTLQAPFISRLKIMAEMDIAERRLPQDGRIPIQHNHKEYDLRASSIPTAFGEKLVLRVLDKSSVMIGLEKLGFTPENYEKIKDLAAQPNGMFLCTGPTGSGKTTTLYSILQMINKEAVNILTVEDPVEYQIPGIGQVQINRKAGLNFASTLRAFLRQDPDVIMVGEMRDLETAQIAVESALTGHLVLSTLHTNSAPSTILRLIDMGIEPYLISATIIGILTQRLGRKLCPECKQPHQVSASDLARLGFKSKDPGQLIDIYRPIGCSHCRNTGYKGRIGFHELMLIDDDLSELIVQRASVSEIKEAACIKGMKELKDDGLAKVLAGDTDPQEVLRVVHTIGG